MSALLTVMPFVVIALAVMAWDMNRRTPRQIIDRYEGLKKQIAEDERLLLLGQKERWEEQTLHRIGTERRKRIAEFEHLTGKNYRG